MAIEEFMVTMPASHEPGQEMHAVSPDGQRMKFKAPIVQSGKQFPVAYAPGGRGGEPPVDTDLMMVMHDVLHQYEVSTKKAADLLILKDYDIILLVDDSGSMRRVDRQQGATASRWEELRSTLELVVSMASCFDKDGLDIYFLNRAKISGVRSVEDASFVEAMRQLPYGGTPLTKALVEIVTDRERAARLDSSLHSKPILLMIFTDGVPDNGADQFGNALRRVLRQETTDLHFRCQVLACTGNDADIDWLNKLDMELKELDVTDDYLTEKAEIEGTFTRGDWCMKAMLGAVNSAYGDQDDQSKRKRFKKGTYEEDPGTTQSQKEEASPFLKWFLSMACVAGAIYVRYALKRLDDQ